MKKTFAVISFLFVLLFLSVSACCADNNIRVFAELSKKTIRIGEPAELKFVIEYPGELTLTLLDDATYFSKLEVIEKKQSIPSKSAKSKKNRATLEFKLTAYESGEYETAEYELVFARGQEEFRRKLPKYNINVEEFKGKVLSEIIDIKKPFEPTSYRGLLALLIFAIFVAAAIIFIKRKKGKIAVEVAEESVPTKTPAENALEKLNKLLESGLLAEGRVKEFYIILSDIFRIYLEEKHGVASLEKTTHEIYQRLRAVADKKYALRSKELLENCDIVKFAKYIPHSDEIETCVNKFRELIL